MEGELSKRLAELAKKEKVISSPTRLSIMILLYLNMKMKFTTLQKTLNLTPGNLSSHLRKLEKNELIRIKKGFVQLKPTTMIYITEKGVEELKKFLKDMKTVLEEII